MNYCCDSFKSAIGASDESHQNEDGSWSVGDGNGCYALTSIRFCPFCGSNITAKDQTVTWKDKLREAIEALKEKDWKTTSFAGIIPGTDRVATVTVLLGERHGTFGVEHVDKVNATKLCGVDRGKIIYAGFGYDTEGAKARFLIRRDVPWNEQWNDRTKQFEEIRDKGGQPPYPYFEFNSLP